jgi:Uma2 family endonuclease
MASDVTEVDYPTSDGRPMAESDLHREVMFDLIHRLAHHYAGRDDVYVSGNLMVYYEEGAPKRFLAPDAFVVLGVRPGFRPLYKAWEEGKLPDVVFEVTSKTTAKEDRRKKLRLYEDTWKVRECFLFDPTEDWLRPPLQGFRRERGFFQPVPPAADGTLASQALGLTLAHNGPFLRLTDTATGAVLLTPAEAGQRLADEERRRADEERRRADALQRRVEAAEAEARRVQAELAALRRKPGN